MADATKIEWTEATWNPITGCTVHSAGCTNCYAMKLAGTRLRNHPSRAGLTTQTKAGPVWNGKVRFNEEWLTQPLKWKRPRMIFVCAHADLFHKSVPDEWILEIFDIIRQCSYDGGSNIGKIGGGIGQHIFQILTKRSDRMRSFMQRLRYEDRGEKLAVHLSDDGKRPYTPSNVWLGVSVENQAAADERIPDLLATPAAVRWISAEPLLGPVDLTMLHHDGVTNINALVGKHGVLQPMQGECDKIDWVVAGGQSGKDARPMHPDWARSLRDQCAAAGTPFFFKQWGEWVEADQIGCDSDAMLRVAFKIKHQDLLEYRHNFGDFDVARVGKTAAGRLLDDVLHDGMPNGQ